MRNSLKKLSGFYKNGNSNNNKEHKKIRPLAQLDELAQAFQDMEDMKDCYDSLLSVAAATANSSYEFSESLGEMGSCLLKKTALNDDEDTGRVLLELGKKQYEVQKLVDSYRSHISQTITVPSESLLKELRTVEEMKRQCDEKREVYEYMKARVGEKGKPKNGNRESFSQQRLQIALDEYDQEATLFIFRLKSLKQGQSRSLLTQAARHHAAQLCFFRKGLRLLEAVEPQVKQVTEQQHIDYHFDGLEDDDSDDYDTDDDDDSYDSNDDGELSFDYEVNDREQQDGPTSRNLMEVDQVDLTFPKVGKFEDPKALKEINSVSFNPERPQRSPFLLGANKIISQSAPIIAENNKADPAEKLKPSFTRKFHSYVLPTPLDKNATVSVGSGQPKPAQISLTERTQNLWHSTPLEPKMYEKIMSGGKIYPPTNIPRHHDQQPVGGSDPKKIKRQAFSGPLTSKQWTAKTAPLNHPTLFSGPLLRNPSPSPPKTSPGTSPTFTSSPKISELHELPRPPVSATPRLSGLVGYSGPLVSRGSQAQGYFPSKTAAKSPLPKPPQVVPRSFSIPSSGDRIVELNAPKPMDISGFSVARIVNGLVSPPLSPITLPSN